MSGVKKTYGFQKEFIKIPIRAQPRALQVIEYMSCSPLSEDVNLNRSESRDATLSYSAAPAPPVASNTPATASPASPKTPRPSRALPSSAAPRSALPESPLPQSARDPQSQPARPSPRRFQ